MLGAALVVTFVVAGVFFGGVHHRTRSATHLLLALTLLVAAALPSERLARGGRLFFVAGAGALLVMAEAIGLFTSHDAEKSLDAITHLTLGVGLGVAVGAWGLAVGRRDSLLWPVFIGTAALVGLAAAHLGSGTSTLFGIWAPHEHIVHFHAPFVNKNHFAGAMLLAFPAALATALGHHPTRVRLAAGALATLFAAAVLFTGAGGPLAILAFEGLMVGTLVWRPFAIVGVAVAPVAAWLSLRWASAHGADAVQSGLGRLEMWRAAGRMLLDHPLLGAGAGTFREAIEPYRSEARWEQWGHAHNDWLEWLAETGIVGVLLAVGAVMLLVRWRPRRSRTVRHLTLGMLGILLYALVDFPLQIPVLLMATFAIVAWRTVVGQQALAVPSSVVRAVLVPMAGVQLVCAFWQLRGAWVEDATRRLVAEPSDAIARDVMGRWAPWRPDADIARIRAALAAGDTHVARQGAHELARQHPEDSKALAQAALALLQTGDAGDAVALADRLTELAPWHRGYWKLRAIAHTTVDRSSAAPAWADAIQAESPGAIEAAWEVLPVGLYWVDALEDASSGQQAAMAAHVLDAGDADAALLGFRSAARSNPGRITWGYARLLKQNGQHEELLVHLLQVQGDQARSKAVMQEIAACLGALGRWNESARAWLDVYRAHGVGLGRAAQATNQATDLASASSLWERESLRGLRPGDQDHLDYARAHLEAGDPAGCLRVLTGVRAETPPVQALANRCRQANRR